MLSAKAWALFHAGRLSDARSITDDLTAQRSDMNDLWLDVSLSLASGEWGRLPGIVDRSWDGRHGWDADVLMLLARVSARSGQPPIRAMELARLAAEKADQNPHILISAHIVYLEVGREAEADPQWLARALQNSDDAGPIWTADVEDLERWIPARRRQSESVERKLLAGELPMGVATGVLNAPLSYLLLGHREARGGTDKRGSVVLPIVSGARTPLVVQEAWRVGMDLTSVMLLGRLGLLDTALSALGSVKVAADAMLSLYEERAAVRFHQPALVRRAEELRRLIVQGRVEVAEALDAPPADTTTEVGASLASLLETCRRDGGVVICATPLHKAGSLLQELADVAQYQDLIFSPADLCECARARGRISADVHERAKRFMKTQGQLAGSEWSDLPLDGPVYVDQLALTYLHLAGTLPMGGVSLRVHPDVDAETNALLQAGQFGDELAEQVEAIAMTLRQAIESGTVSLLPHMSERRDEEPMGPPGVSSVAALLQADSHCDVYCVDDRFVNQHAAVSGAADRTVRIICVLDVLRYLRDHRDLNDQEYWTARHRLREAGSAFVPLEADELVHWLKGARHDDARLVESVELRTIRQVTGRIEALEMTSEREAAVLSAELQLVFADAIRQLWADEALDPDSAATLSTWVWRHLGMTAHLGSRASGGEGYRNWLRATVAIRVQPCLFGPAVTSSERMAAYRDWLEDCVVNRLKPANADVIETALANTLANVAAVDVHREMVGGVVSRVVPPRVLRFICDG